MTQNIDTSKAEAPLRNITILDDLLTKVQNRPEHLPGIATFSGPSGFGKSTAAAFVNGKHQCCYLEIRSTWTKKAFLEKVLFQLGIQSGKTVYDMLDKASEELACSRRPLILDEFDNAVDRKLVEIVRDLYEQSRTPIILIGEERLPQKLQRWERFHGRIMEWAQAVPADLGDAKVLNRFYAQNVEIEDDLLSILVEQARGSVRRIVTNIEQIRIFAERDGRPSISKAAWGARPLYTSKLPTPRRF